MGSLWLNIGYLPSRQRPKPSHNEDSVTGGIGYTLQYSTQGSDDEAPVCKARRAVSPVIPKVSTSTASSTIVSSVTSYSGMATSYDLPVSRPLSILYGGQPPILPVSMPLLRFATKDFVQSPVRSALVATRPYPSSPESYASTTCVDLDASDCSGSSDGHISVSPVESDCVSVSSVNFGDNDHTNIAIELSRFQPLSHPHSPVDVSGNLQVVVELPSHYEAPAVPINIFALIECVVQLSQISALSSVQLSPNRVRDDYTCKNVDVFPVYQVSLDTTGCLPVMSPVTPPVTGSLPTSLIPLGPDSLPSKATGSLNSLISCQSLM